MAPCLSDQEAYFFIAPATGRTIDISALTLRVHDRPCAACDDMGGGGAHKYGGGWHWAGSGTGMGTRLAFGVFNNASFGFSQLVVPKAPTSRDVLPAFVRCNFSMASSFAHQSYLATLDTMRPKDCSCIAQSH